MVQCVIKFLTLVILLPIAQGWTRSEDKTPPSETEALLYDANAPVVKTEFSVILLSRDTDCYYHYVPKYAVMQFQFRVTTTPSTMARGVVSVNIKAPNGDRIFNAHFKKTDEMIDKVAQESGYYEICIYNSLERFADKKVDVLFTYFNAGSHEEKAKEANETASLADQLSGSVTNLMIKAMIMQRTLRFIRIFESADYEFQLSMAEYIKTASIVTCITIAIVMYIQVYSLKRLFNVPIKTSPRA